MSSGNHLAEQGQKEYNLKGACPLDSGIMYPIIFCDTFKDICDKRVCDIFAKCKRKIEAWKCKSCGHVERE